MSRSDDRTIDGPNLTEREREALHRLQLGVEHVYRGYGHLLGFHHQIGHGMEHVAEAERLLRAAGHEAFANELRDRLLPAGAVGDRWTYEVVEDFRRGFLASLTDVESEVRGDLAGGLEHVTERRQQRDWRERAESDSWRHETRRE